MNFKRPVLFLLCALALASGASAERLQYHRHLVFRESPMEDLRGRHEISAEQAKTTLHHRFRYDDQGRLTEVRRAVGDTVTRNPGSFEGFFWWAPQVRIEYLPGREIRSFYNEAGDRIAAHGPVWRMEFTLDAQGRRSTLHYFDKDGQPVEGQWGAHRYTWEYPEPGVVIETRHKLNGDSAPLRPNFLFHRVRLEFGHDDLLDTMLNIDAQGQLVATNSGSAVDRIVYDPWGSFVRWQVYDTQRRPKNGNDPMVATGEHVYDGLGQAIMLRGFGEQGEDRALDGTSGPTTYAYDAHGNQTRQQLRNMKGELDFEVRLSYSAEGSRLEWVRYFDGQGKPSSPPGLPPALAGMVAQQLQYDARGLRTAPIRYGADGKPLPAR
ncbi:RHS repeat protein [Inhella gelatinilytica]|uniref:RHS repeat protein n=1 Tax=Inhella gelatinilytica TaxID=2795030 RepID=A0A931IT61_9BURK|nr:RHS repeat protein [Inhella gelatinilytica]MBH9551532.1 RHS repeat protein [Inhella gelatinilytica]